VDDEDMSMAESSTESQAMDGAAVEVGVSLSAVSAVAMTVDEEGIGVDLDVEAADGLVGVGGVCFFCFFDAGRRGHVCES
jgi:hypothetical protein